MTMKDHNRTVFQDIWSGVSPCYELGRFEDHDLMVMLGPKPVRRGHCLVVPRQPIDHWHDLPPKLAMNATKLGQITAKHLIAVLSPRPARVELHVMGYREPHTHLKIIPSYAKSDNRALFEGGEPRPDTAAEELISAHQELIFPDELIKAIDSDLRTGSDEAISLIQSWAA